MGNRLLLLHHVHGHDDAYDVRVCVPNGRDHHDRANDHENHVYGCVISHFLLLI